MNIAAVIFDRDNTLLEFDPQAQIVMRERMAACSPSITPKVFEQHWRAWPGPWPRHAADEPSFWLSFWSAAAPAYGLDPERIRALCEIGASYHTCYRAFPDSLNCLWALRSAGLRLAVLTNFELPSVDRTLAHAGIDPQLFDVTLSSGALGVSKPDPRPYRAAAAALCLPLERCAFIDNLPANVVAARALGMRAFLLDRQPSPAEPAADVISSLSQLVQVLVPPSSLA